MNESDDLPPIAEIAKLTTVLARQYGIEWTPVEVEDLIRDSFKVAIRDHWRRQFLRWMEAPED